MSKTKQQMKELNIKQQTIISKLKNVAIYTHLFYDYNSYMIH